MLTALQRESIVHYLSSIDGIDFVILFGSHARKRSLPMSDVDLAIGMQHPLPLLERGRMIAELEGRIKVDVDLVVLNTLSDDNPRLAYDIFATGTVLYMNDNEAYTALKEETMKRVLDTAYLRKIVDKRFLEGTEQ